MAAKFSDNDETIADINITPFVDIILVVLIIFMLATPVIMNPGINVNLPKASSGESTTPSQITLSINQDGAIFLNGKALPEDEVQTKISEMVKKNPDSQAILAADQAVSHGVVIRILDKVKAAGVRKFAISTQKK